MNRSVAIGGVVVVAAGAFLFWKFRGSDEVPPTTAGATDVPAIRDPSIPPISLRPELARPAQIQPRNGSSSRGTSVTVGEGDSNAEPTPTTSTYQIGNVQVRDHRGSNIPPMDLPPNIHAPDARKVSSTLVSELTQKMKGVVTTCARDIPPEARGPKPRIEGEIVIAIKDHQVSITSSLMKLRDVVGAAVDPTQQCLDKGAVALTHVAPDEADLANYTITLTYNAI